ncbi:radical SAM protein [archaeon]|nr:MAG: radical SAM protein [archaeon]
MRTIKGLTYWLNNRLYVAVTNKTNSMSPLAVRGPSFFLPASSGFEALEDEPDAVDIKHAVDLAFDQGKVGVTSMGSDEITFQGIGEPLLRRDVVMEAAQLIKESRHGVQLRLRTNGLIPESESFSLATNLKACGIKHVVVSLMTDNPKQYVDIMQPKNDLGFGEVCNFVMACVESGLMVGCTAVNRPDVRMAEVRALAQSLGAQSFKEYSYHP